MNRRRFLVALAAIPAALVVPKSPVAKPDNYWDTAFRDLKWEQDCILSRTLSRPLTGSAAEEIEAAYVTARRTTGIGDRYMELT